MTSGQPHPRWRSTSIMGAHPLVLVGLGGAVGSLARHGVISTQLDASVAVFVVNIVGSLALGSIVGWLQHADSSLHGAAGEAKDHWAALLGLGFCGGLTTFSTHMVDVAQRLDTSSSTSAVFSLLVTATFAVAVAGAGYSVTRHLVQPGAGGTS